MDADTVNGAAFQINGNICRLPHTFDLSIYGAVQISKLGFIASGIYSQTFPIWGYGTTYSALVFLACYHGWNPPAGTYYAG